LAWVVGQVDEKVGRASEESDSSKEAKKGSEAGAEAGSKAGEGAVVLGEPAGLGSWQHGREEVAVTGKVAERGTGVAGRMEVWVDWARGSASVSVVADSEGGTGERAEGSKEEGKEVFITSLNSVSFAEQSKAAEVVAEDGVSAAAAEEGAAAVATREAAGAVVAKEGMVVAVARESEQQSLGDGSKARTKWAGEEEAASRGVAKRGSETGSERGSKELEDGGKEGGDVGFVCRG
jgi:hypothetical protein